MQIDKKKKRSRDSYGRFLDLRQPIRPAQNKAPLSRDFFQEGCGAERFLGKADL